MKFDHIAEYNKRNVFAQKSDENEIGRLVPDFFLFFKKDLYAVKVKSSAAWFQYVSVVLNLLYRKNKLYKT